MYLAQNCAPIYASDIAEFESWQAGHDQAASPQFSMPVQLKSVDPAWGACKPFPLGVWDPPRTLSSVSAMDPTTQHIAATTPVASPGVSPTPLVTPTASHTDPTSRGKHDPKNPADPKQTVDPKNTADPKQTADPASSKIEDGLFHSAAASQADPAIDESLGLRPSRTQNPGHHSDQVDPDPSASLSTHPSPEMTSIGDHGGTAAGSPSGADDSQDSTSANGQDPLGQNAASAVPVDLPVFDPMAFFGAHHGSSHRTSASNSEASSKNDAASKTHVAHTQSTTDSAVEAHDPGVGNGINPAVMSKGIGIDNIFGGAAGAGSTRIGGEIDPASKSQSADINISGASGGAHATDINIPGASGGAHATDINIPGVTGGAHATDISSQVGLSGTSESADFGSEFNSQETARPSMTATIGAQSSEPSERTEKTGLYQGVNGGVATATQATQNGQYEPGSTTRGLSLGSSGTGASNPSILDGPSSSMDDSRHGSPATSETPRSGRSNNLMSTSNSDGLVSDPAGISGAEMTSAVGIGPQSAHLTNSHIRATARLTSSASITSTTGSTATDPVAFTGQGTRLLPSSALSAFTLLVASAICINQWIW